MGCLSCFVVSFPVDLRAYPFPVCYSCNGQLFSLFLWFSSVFLSHLLLTVVAFIFSSAWEQHPFLWVFVVQNWKKKKKKKLLSIDIGCTFKTFSEGFQWVISIELAFCWCVVKYITLFSCHVGLSRGWHQPLSFWLHFLFLGKPLKITKGSWRPRWRSLVFVEGNLSVHWY